MQVEVLRVSSGRLQDWIIDICVCCREYCLFFFFKQKTAYEMRISDWSSDVCSSDLRDRLRHVRGTGRRAGCPRQHAESARDVPREIGRASCRERVCQYVLISVVAVSFNKKKTSTM